MESNFILQELSEGLLHLQIDRQEKRNALNGKVVDELIEIFKSARSNSELKAIIISGRGDIAYCAGADLAELDQREERVKVFEHIASLFSSIIDCDVPVISLVKGYALAGGIGLIACSDIVIATDDSVIGLPEIKVGLVPAMVISCLRNSVNQKILADMIVTGRTIDAHEALRLGLFSRVIEKSEFDSAVDDLLKSLQKGSLDALLLTKKIIKQEFEMPSKERLLQLAEFVGTLSKGETASKRIAKWLNR